MTPAPVDSTRVDPAPVDSDRAHSARVDSGATRIRPLRLGDVAAASALQVLAFPHDAWSAQSLRDELAAGTARWWVIAESSALETSALESAASEIDALGSSRPAGRSIVGLAGSSWAGDVVDVLSLAVHPAARRRGTGRALLGELLAQARSTGAARVLLEVAADNDGAIALYAASGFRPISRRRGYYAGPAGPATVDALVLELVLP